MTKIIGTLGERSLHYALKLHYEPTGLLHEIPVGRYIADIKPDDTHIIEIQTQGFDRLRTKLSVFLPEHIVTIVCPLAHIKHIVMLDEDTGEILSERRSPKKCNVHHVFPELYKIRALLSEPSLRIRIALLEVEEQRFRTKKNRKGYSRIDSVLLNVISEMSINSVADYAKLVPADLPEQFTSPEYAKAAKISIRGAQTALNVLSTIGAVQKVGKLSRHILYAATPE